MFFFSQNVALFATVCLDVGGGSFSEKLLSLAQLILIFFFRKMKYLLLTVGQIAQVFPNFLQLLSQEKKEKNQNCL